KYGNGLARVRINERDYLHHTGGMVSFCSAMHVDVAADVAAFASTNVHYGLGYRPRGVTILACELMRMIQDGGPEPTPAPTRAVLPDIQPFVGVYTAASGESFELRANGDSIAMRYNGRDSETQPVAPIAFACNEPRFSQPGLIFDIEDDKVVRAWVNDEEFVRDVSKGYLPPAPPELRALAASNAVAVSTVRASAPTVLRYINEMDWIDINQNLYRTTDISSTPSLLSALTRTDCYYSDLNGPISLNPVTVFAYDENGNHIYDENGYAVGYYDWLCFPEWEAIRTNWKSQATGATLASSKLLYQGAQSVLVALGDPDTPVPFVIQYPRSYNRPSAPSVTYERSFYLRRLQWNAATPAIDGYQFWNYRGMHTSDVTSRYWKGSESTPWATWEVQKSRPPIRFAEPVPFDSIDSRYQ
ncbi:MAG TPA: hypothetical protein PLJ65_11355, partial [Casimicrobium sp.]|nr:hypothetical protein [Casimicrobium sp.]